MLKKYFITLFIIIPLIFLNNIYPQDKNPQDKNPQDRNLQDFLENQDNSSFNWFTTSTSKDDFIIADYFDILSFDEQITAIPYIAKRKDRDFSLLLDKIYYQEADDKNEKEFILYLMLHNFFNDKESIEKSKDSFFTICENISNYKNSILRKKIMEKTVFLDNKKAENILLKESKFLLNEGKKNSKFNLEMLEESRIFFLYSGKIDSSVLNDYRQMIYVTVSNIPDFTF